ncbi:MAG: hypothetical protein QG566_124 [Patescibacteria group bacterium]|jgi:hypothetical protein|nr:hypothetical protein [Patescibacteria group bacterium]
MKHKINNLKNWIKRNNKILMPLSLVLGFVIDYITLNRVDRAFENIVFTSYLFFAIVGIFIFNYLRGKEIKNKFLEKVYIFSPYVIQFMFGGLFSGFAVFYYRSGSLASSWFFIFLLLVLMLGNDIFKKHYENFVLQITIFFTGLFFYYIFAVPVILNAINVKTFLISGFASMLSISVILYMFSYFLIEVKNSSRNLIVSIVLVYIFVNGLYFANLIPPIPLSLKRGEAYNAIYKLPDGYHVVGEKEKGFLNFNKVVNIREGDPVYAYSAVFSPTDINTNIMHDWQYYNPEIKKWESITEISFPISGGNLNGYRGYSYKTSLKEGKWRVRVETMRGQVIGTIGFEVRYTQPIPMLIEKVL